jgi:hypothetical protein
MARGSKAKAIKAAAAKQKKGKQETKAQAQQVGRTVAAVCLLPTTAANLWGRRRRHAGSEACWGVAQFIKAQQH